MSLQIILGGPGSNQSEIIYKEMIADTLAHPEKKYILIVPEQFTMQTQKKLTALHPGHSVMQIEIVGFIRLAHRVFEELAVNIPDIIDDSGKSMMLRRVLGQVQEELHMYASKVGNAGFVSQMKSLISEFYQYGIGEKELEGMQELSGRKPLLKAKLADSEVILAAFQKALADRFITTEEILERFCQVAEQSAFLRESEIVIDGFAGNPFTPVQMRTIGELLLISKGLTVTACMEEADAKKDIHREQDLFYKSHAACMQIKEMAKEAGISVLPDRVLSSAGDKAPEIEFIEKHFYRYEKAVYEDRPEHLHVFAAKTPKEEAEAAADLILRLRKEGYRYRDIAVITGDMERYQRELSYECRENQIPFFMDCKRNLFDNAFVETLRAALEVLERDFSYESVFRYAKAGLHDVEPGDVYLLENYVLQTGIRGASAYEKVWEFLPAGWNEEKQARVNAAKETLITPLRTLRESMRGRFAVKEGTAAIRSLIESLGMEEKLSSMTEWFSGEGSQDKVREYSQILEAVFGLLEQMEQVLGGDMTGVREFAEIFDAGLSEKKVGVIPPAVDQVLIGSTDRSRIGNVKVLIFLGLNEGIVPKTMDAGGIFTDADREFLLRANIRLAPTAREQAFEDRFSVYYFLTKPSEKLYLFYARTDNGGKVSSRSSVVNLILDAFPQTLIEETNQHTTGPVTKRRGKRYLAEGLRESAKTKEVLDAVSNGMLSYLLEEEEAEAWRLMEGAVYTFDAGSIGKHEIRALYESIYKPSITGLEQFAGCPYRYFMSGGVELKERKEYRVEQTDIGTLFHDAIEYYGESLRKRDMSWEEITPEERSALVRESVDAAAKGKSGKVILSDSSLSARNRYVLKRVERMTERAVWALGEHIKHTEIKPSYYEYPVRRGRIDRVDTFDDGEHVYVKIIDYKSGNKIFRMEDMYYGLQLQLVLYMREAMENIQKENPGKQVVPAGFFYFHIKDPYRKMDHGGLLKEEDKEKAEKELLGELRMSGYVNRAPGVIAMLDDSLLDEEGNPKGKSDFIPVEYGKSGLYKTSHALTEQELRDVLSYAGEKEQKLRENIWNGTIEAKPYKKGTFTECTYCPYVSVCGFDTKLKGAKYRYYPKKKTEDILEEIAGKEAEDGSELDRGTETGN